MSLFEANSQDAPSLLISASTVGEALKFISREFGQKALYQLDEIIELQPDNFILMRRCGLLTSQNFLLAHCPESEHRIFFVRDIESSEEAILSVNSIKYLPFLILNHFEKLSSQVYKLEEVLKIWPQYQDKFYIYEIDTQSKGILLIYSYCTCSMESHEPVSPPIVE